MKEVESGGTANTLEYFHTQLEAHFRALHARRQELRPPAYVFALEHGLTEDDLRLLQEAVREAHCQRLLGKASRMWWLPLVAHAAEVGYAYDGIEYWPMYARAIPGWDDNEHERDRVRSWFRKFAEQYGGAIPQGAWAATFTKIAWPITHAVLPRYLQVQLARLLYDYRTGWPSLIHDPAALGVHLHSWSLAYSERLEKFCQNTALVGHVAVALLLAGEEEESPYLETMTLDRIVASLNSERQSRRWLRDARHSASVVKTHNFRQPTSPSAGGNKSSERRLPAGTDPKLYLQRHGGVWRAYAALADLKPLQHRLPTVYDELRRRRAVIQGAERQVPAGGLLYATPPVEFTTWPSPTEPFLQLRGAPPEVNLLIADQCRTTSGPWWVFRCKPGQPAVEIRGKFVRTGHKYCIVGASDRPSPKVAWCERVDIATPGMAAYQLSVPSVLNELDARVLVSAGISVITDVSIRPVGVVAASWDGEGSAEWSAGEPMMIAIHAEHAPAQCRLTINGDPYYLTWPDGQTEMYLSLDDLAVGTYDITVSLGDADGGGRRAEGTITLAIRDPQIEAAGQSSGEGIRLRTSPAQPSLPELWDGRAKVMIDGPDKVTADLIVTLQTLDGARLRTRERNITLPVTADIWRREFGHLRDDPELAKHYDDADRVELVIRRAGVGFAALSCERGFRALRWVISTRHRDGGYNARLIDRTDGKNVTAMFFPVEQPLTGQTILTDQEFVGPARGGLLRAHSDGQDAIQIIPPDPNQLLRLRPVEPAIPTDAKSLAAARSIIRGHRLWRDADLPADPFGRRERQRVLDALTRSMAILLAPGNWARFERQLAGRDSANIDLDRAMELVGELRQYREVAAHIASSLWRWDTAGSRNEGFADAIVPLAQAARIPNVDKGARFLLKLATSPGDLTSWGDDECDRYLRCVLTSPVLIRAARFVALGTADSTTEGAA